MTDNIKLPKLPEPDICRYVVTVWRDGVECEIDKGPRYTVEQMQAYAREAVRLNAQAVPEPAYVELPDDIRVPLDSVFADAGYLIGRLLLGTMSAAQVIRAIQDKIEVAKAATRTALSAAPAAPQPAQQSAEDAVTWQELEAFRKRHWTHWNASDNLLIAHLVQTLRTNRLPQPAQPLTNRQAGVCTSPLRCEQHGCHGACLPTYEQAHGIGVKND